MVKNTTVKGIVNCCFCPIMLYCIDGILFSTHIPRSFAINPPFQSIYRALLLFFPLVAMIFPFLGHLHSPPYSSHVQPTLPACLASWWKVAPRECRRLHLSFVGLMSVNKNGSIIPKFTMFKDDMTNSTMIMGNMNKITMCMGDVNKYNHHGLAGFGYCSLSLSLYIYTYMSIFTVNDGKLPIK